MRKSLVAAFLICLVFAANRADAGVGQLLWKGAEFVGNKARKVVQEGVETLGKRTSSESGESVSKTVVKAVSPNGFNQTGMVATVQAAKVPTVSALSAVGTIRSHLGDARIQSMGTLTPVGATRLAEISAELSHNPQRAEWLNLIGKSGDAVATYLWERKGSVAVATVATAAVLAPGDFLRASENLIESTIVTTGTSLVEPLISRTVEQVAAPVSKIVAAHAAASFPWLTAWLIVLAATSFGVGYWLIKKR